METISVDARILTALRGSNRGVSGASLSRELGLTRAAVWARIEEMRKLGYDIEASPHHGYKLLRCPPVLYADDMMSRLVGNKVIGREIKVYRETSSTNDIVDRIAGTGGKEGLVVFADKQHAGRGRMGRTWVSPPGKGLWFSLLLRPELRTSAATQITIAAAASLARAIHSTTGLQVDIKWPNDLLAKDKKLAGILTEIHADIDLISYMVVGIGINLNLGTEDIPESLKQKVTSIALETGEKVDPMDIACSCLQELDRDYQRVCSGLFPEISQEWERQCKTLGRMVSVQAGSRKIEGRAESLDSEGALMVRTEFGLIERVTGGDVQLLKG